jgi:hypothetical protein
MIFVFHYELGLAGMEYANDSFLPAQEVYRDM